MEEVEDAGRVTRDVLTEFCLFTLNARQWTKIHSMFEAQFGEKH